MSPNHEAALIDLGKGILHTLTRIAIALEGGQAMQPAPTETPANEIGVGTGHPLDTEESMSRRIFNYVAGNSSGYTADQVEEALQLSHQSCSPRWHEMIKCGVFKATGEKRVTRSRGHANAYVVAAGKTYEDYSTAKHTLNKAARMAVELPLTVGKIRRVADSTYYEKAPKLVQILLHERVRTVGKLTTSLETEVGITATTLRIVLKRLQDEGDFLHITPMSRGQAPYVRISSVDDALLWLAQVPRLLDSADADGTLYLNGHNGGKLAQAAK